ncbi:MAG: hemolysin III family protein [Firmicutes bacterium]|nr:hemolysin III family protein [Bacillota bacterium]HOB21955.1 hemolysin III family protein [Bacillota bacterium]HQD40414.1 hemolysin III family protein [Bacillota bacterium]
MKFKIKDPVSALTHFGGALMSVAGLVFLIIKATGYSIWHVVSLTTFGVSLILLYTASTVYHAVITSKRWEKLLRKIDHMMIFVLIAGSYTPICLLALRGPLGWSLFGSIWGLTIAGLVMKAVWLSAPRWLSTIIYAVMGWLICIAIVPFSQAVSSAGVGLLFGGGLFYSSGAVIYGLKWPNLKGFGFHELFHVLVLGGSICHYIMMYRYLMP